MSLLEKFIESSYLIVSWGRSSGKTLLLLSSERYLQKTVNNLVFSLKSVMNLFSLKKGGYLRTFLTMTNMSSD